MNDITLDTPDNEQSAAPAAPSPAPVQPVASIPQANAMKPEHVGLIKRFRIQTLPKPDEDEQITAPATPAEPRLPKDLHGLFALLQKSQAAVDNFVGTRAAHRAAHAKLELVKRAWAELQQGAVAPQVVRPFDHSRGLDHRVRQTLSKNLNP